MFDALLYGFNNFSTTGFTTVNGQKNTSPSIVVASVAIKILGAIPGIGLITGGIKLGMHIQNYQKTPVENPFQKELKKYIIRDIVEMLGLGILGLTADLGYEIYTQCKR